MPHRAPTNMINRFRLRLAHAEAVPQLALLGILSGIITGAIIIIFRQVISLILGTNLPGGNEENFEGLATHWRFLLPILGALSIAVLFAFIAPKHRRVGVMHVIERMGLHQGHLPLKNLLTQFTAATIALVSGQSSGREGPAVHLGAASSSLLGQWLKLPNNSVRTLVGCGSAAAISAAFSTPIAGVIFAMEVVMMEYTISGFIPVILASVIAAYMTELVYGSSHAFIIPLIEMRSLLEVPLVIICGFTVGCVAACFIWMSKHFNRFGERPPWQRLLLAGTITGVVAIYYPQVMGIGYDTISEILLNTTTLNFLLWLLLAKLIVTAAACGLGVPAGIIGPSLFLGACLGGAIGLISQILYSGPSSGSGFYAMLGMGAMMAAVLQAPLAALMAVMELTHTPGIILPVMLAVVVASLTSRHLFGQSSIFAELMDNNLADHPSPLTQSLRREGVTNVMESSIFSLPRYCSVTQAKAAIAAQKTWILIYVDEQPYSILWSEELATYLTHSSAADNFTQPPEQDSLDLLAIPAQRKDVTSISSQATLQEALATLQSTGTEALYIKSLYNKNSAEGIVTLDYIQQHYQIHR